MKLEQKIEESKIGVSLGARILRKLKRSTKKKKDRVHFIQESGQMYLNKMNQSDMRLKNRPDPHAFIQFNPMALSRKLRLKASKTFEDLMKKKKKGAFKGLKITK